MSGTTTAGRGPLERYLSLRQQLLAGVLLGALATASVLGGLRWLDARTPDPPGFDATLLLAVVGVAVGAAVGWGIVGRVERRIADLAVYATALANERPALPRTPGAAGALAELVGGLNGVAARLGAQEERLRELSDHSARLTAPLREAAAQEERNRLARELHDTIKQQLFSIGVTAAAAEARWVDAPPEARTFLADIRALAGEAQVEMRALLTQLRPTPVAQIGLLAALREQLDALAYRAEVAVEADLRPLPDGQALAPGAEDALFRIAQEGLANIARHARARHVRVSFGPAPGDGPGILAELVIADDGQGFDPALVEAGAGMGLRNMRTRADESGGTLAVAATPTGGTTLTVRLPLYRPPVFVAPQEDFDMDRYIPELRRQSFFRALSTGASVAFCWSVVAFGLRPDWPRSVNLLALALLIATLGSNIRADLLARRFRTLVGDAREWTLRLERNDHLAHIVEYALAAIVVPVLINVILRGTVVAPFIALFQALTALSYASLFLWSLWRLVGAERSLSALGPRWTTRARLEKERTAQVTNLTTNVFLLTVFSSLLSTRIVSDPATLDQWLRATLGYPLIALAFVAAWGLAWNQRRLSQAAASGAAAGTSA